MSKNLGVGASLLRKEDKRHLAGRGEFTSDLDIPGTWEVAFVRSPIAHGKILEIEAPAGFSGHFFTHDDFPDIKPIRSIPETPGFRPSSYHCFAKDKVRFVGEVVAVCVAPTRGEAEDMAQACFVEYEELPAVVDSLQALEPDTVLLHDDWEKNSFIETSLDVGDIDAVSASAPIVIEREFRMNRHSGVPMEGRAVLTYWDHRLDELVVYSSTQFPHQIRAGLAQHLDIQERQMHVIAPDVGGGFGIKNILYPEEIILSALGMKLDHPVRWVEDRREHFVSAIHAREHLHRIKAYADREGRILGVDADVYVDAGAYSHWPNSPFMETGMVMKNIPGPYDFRNYRARSHTVATNKPPIGPYRGVSRPAACFTIERIIDEIAHAVGKEPFEVRMMNMVKKDQMPYRTVTDLLYDGGDYGECVRQTKELIDLEAVRERQKAPEADGRLIGVGFASFTEQTAHGCGEWVTRGVHVIPGFESCTARLMTDGSLHLLVGIQSHGQGLETSLAQVANQELGIDPDRVSVRHGDTSISPFGMGTFASRSMVMAGGAVARACRTIKAKMAEIAAHMLQCKPDQVSFSDGALHGPTGASVTLEQIGHAGYLRQDGLPSGMDPMIEAVETYEPNIATGVFCYSTQAAVVAVTPETGAVEIIDYAVVEDAGTLVNPMIVDGQIHGGVAQGIGTALFEEIPYSDEGQPLATTFADYIMPGAAEVPHIKIGHMCTPTEHTEYGMKGMGEGGAISPPAAIANAIRDALSQTGAELNETPMTPRRVKAAIDAAQSKV
ncbi:xanthine dehydrogenase family protein molybdopterin-binding subunit [Ruegeria atlantica]|uniref:xanthine dehydrogenase family protein molybdopterin-binding subunit n=1 Tax=Ruegeria atlantica TaxID=81569 RepID=UPI00147AC97B|nr:xanthine dehydrogenase family protein molybdopterin-binding subunit [Ruegeria atlantica]